MVEVQTRGSNTGCQGCYGNIFGRESGPEILQTFHPETVDIVRKIGESLIFMSPDCFDAHPTRLDHVVRRPLSMCLKFKLKLVIFGNPACEL